MNIILAIILELLTIAGSKLIDLKSIVTIYRKMTENGCKIDEKALDAYLETTKEEEKNKAWDKASGVLLKISRYIPIINLAVSKIGGEIMIKRILNDPEVKKVIKPMTDAEIIEYNLLDSSLEKLMYIATLYKDSEDTNDESTSISENNAEESPKKINPEEVDIVRTEVEYYEEGAAVEKVIKETISPLAYPNYTEGYTNVEVKFRDNSKGYSNDEVKFSDNSKNKVKVKKLNK